MTKSKKRSADDKMPVSEYALIRRINRLLKKRPLDHREECRLLKTRAQDEEKVRKFGVFYIVDDAVLVRTHVKLEAFAREFGALAPYEVIAS
jgi:hypothetical protein